MELPLKIDIHTHILPENWPDLKEKYGYGGFVRLEHHKPCCARMLMDDKFFREVEHNCWDPHVRMQEGDQVGCQVQVLSTVPVMFSYWAQAKHVLDLSMLLNDHIAGICQDFPKRFVGLGTLPLQAPDLAVKELERCKAIGLKGIQIGSHVNEWNLNAPELFPVFAAAQDLDMAVFVHPWDMMGTAKMTQYWLPWLVGMPAEGSLAISSMIFGGIFERLAKSAGGLRPWRRKFPAHHWPHRTWMAREARPLCRGQPQKSKGISRQILDRLHSPRPRHARPLYSFDGRRQDCIGYGLSVSARRMVS
jgi:aminocarboxymuconate-semialdehyde decarboxylase